MTRRSALLIVNTKSRSGKASLESAIDMLGAHGIAPVHRECGTREQLSALIREHGGEVDLVAVAGGDGTMNAAAEGLVATGLPLGILPTGTANDLARTLGIEADLEAAVKVIAAGHTRRIDLGLVNGHPFFNVASMGLSAELASMLTRDIKRRFGKLGYAVTAVRALARARPFRAVIASEEGTARVLTLQIAVGNGRYYGGGNAVEKTATIDDQRLDLYSLEFRRAWKLALLARSFRYGEQGAWDEVRAIRAREFEVTTRRRKAINADGEIVTHTPARFTIRPSAVTVFAGSGVQPVVDQLSRDPHSLARTFAAALRVNGHPKLPMAFDALLVVSPEHGRVLREAGWDRPRLLAELEPLLLLPADELRRGAGGMAEGVPDALAGVDLPKFRPGGLLVVHAGGDAGLFSAVVGGWVSGDAGSAPVTTEVRT